MKIKNLFIFSCVLVLSGCNAIGPAAFWNNFDDSHIVKNISDQGPWGGYRLIYWKNTERPYKAKEVAIFAALHGWEHFRTDSLNNEDVSSWVPDHADSLSLHQPSHYPHIGGAGVSLTFLDSNWVTVGNEGNKSALGYALLSLDGKQLVVFHTWGE
jgi:hypothetical protein